MLAVRRNVGRRRKGVRIRNTWIAKTNLLATAKGRVEAARTFFVLKSQVDDICACPSGSWFLAFARRVDNELPRDGNPMWRTVGTDHTATFAAVMPSEEHVEVTATDRAAPCLVIRLPPGHNILTWQCRKFSSGGRWPRQRPILKLQTHRSASAALSCARGWLFSGRACIPASRSYGSPASSCLVGHFTVSILDVTPPDWIVQFSLCNFLGGYPTQETLPGLLLIWFLFRTMPFGFSLSPYCISKLFLLF
jgi:hypothetical protein